MLVFVVGGWSVRAGWDGNWEITLTGSGTAYVQPHGNSSYDCSGYFPAQAQTASFVQAPATVNLSINASGINSTKIYWYCNGNFGNEYTGDCTLSSNVNGTITFTINTDNCSGGAPNVTNTVDCVTLPANTGTLDKTYYAWGIDGSENYSLGKLVQFAQAAAKTVCWTNSGFERIMVQYGWPGTPEYEEIDSGRSYVVGPNDLGTGTGTSGGGSGGSPTDNNKGSSSNSMVNLDPLLKGIGELNATLNNVAKEPTQIANKGYLSSMDGKLNYLTNVGAGGSGSSETTLRGATNLLGQMVTNSAPNMAGATNYSSTNGFSLDQGSAETAASSAGGSATSGIQGLRDSLGSAPTGLTGAGNKSGLSFYFYNQSIDLDPEVRFPGVMGIIKGCWTFILLVLFAQRVGKLLMATSSTMATAQGGGVPNLNVTVLGTGGNFLGKVVAVIVPVVLIALWVGVFTAITQYVASNLGLLPDASSALGLGGNQVALYLLNSSFPVSLFFGLLFAWIGLQFLASKVILAAAFASRFLITH